MEPPATSSKHQGRIPNCLSLLLSASFEALIIVASSPTIAELSTAGRDNVADDGADDYDDEDGFDKLNDETSVAGGGSDGKQSGDVFKAQPWERAFSEEQKRIASEAFAKNLNGVHYLATLYFNMFVNFKF
jgi:hypothetical protein